MSTTSSSTAAAVGSPEGHVGSTDAARSLDPAARPAAVAVAPRRRAKGLRHRIGGRFEPLAGVARPEPIRRLSIVMPMFNELATAQEAIRRVLKVDIGDVERELIIVESNSTDGTREIVESFRGEPGVTIVLEDRPSGKGHAVRTGLRCVTGDVILIQDGDLEYDVDDYPSLLQPLADGRAAFVLGTRHVKGKPMRDFTEANALSRVLNAAHWIFATMINVLYGTHMTDPFTMYKVFRTECTDGLRFSANRFDFDWELVTKLIRAGFEPLEVPVEYHSRDFQHGKKVRMFRDPLTWMAALVRYRIEPLYR